MENHDFKISNTTVYLLIIGNFFLILLGALAKINHWSIAESFLSGGLLLFFTSWVIILSDMLKHKIYNKTFWLISMFTIPFISMFFYIFQRHKLIRLGQKFS
jgi:hypothetical protein